MKDKPTKRQTFKYAQTNGDGIRDESEKNVP